MADDISRFSIDANKQKSEKLSSCSYLDKILEGGFEKDIVTTIYGPGGSGKTNICLITAINNAKDNRKVIYVDTEGGFSIKRVEQLLGITENSPDYDETMRRVLSNIILVKPKTFKDQIAVIDALDQYIKNNKIEAVIIDSIGMLYRLERSDQDIDTANKDLAKQLNLLHNLADRHKIPVIVTNQVYSLFDSRDIIRMVGGDILTYSSKCLIQLDKEEDYRRIRLKKHRHIAEREDYFIIVDQGIKSFKDES